jgi:multifunctional methyltransferase subunit TRM112
MRLITHNLLACHAARPSAPCVAPNNFPLTFQDVTRIEAIESDVNPEFLRNMMPKIDWPALLGAARQVRCSAQRPTLF